VTPFGSKENGMALGSDYGAWKDWLLQDSLSCLLTFKFKRSRQSIKLVKGAGVVCGNVHFLRKAISNLNGIQRQDSRQAPIGL